MKKPWWKSRTVWLNVIGAIMSSIELYMGMFPYPWMGPSLLLAFNIANVILRFDTDEGIE